MKLSLKLWKTGPPRFPVRQQNAPGACEVLCRKHEISRDVPLHEFTTLRIGGTAELFSQPHSRDELLGVVDDCRKLGVPYRVLGRGSNMFISGSHIEGLVIRCTEACQELTFAGNLVEVGASLPLQQLLLAAARNNLAGMDYLYSVPGNVGGAIYMNAGRGKSFGRFISDHVKSVELYDGRRVRIFTGRQCRFAYRTSVFHDLPDAVILGCTLQLETCDAKVAQAQLHERIRFVKETQDNTRPNAGSVYREGLICGPDLMGVRQGDAIFSKKTQNWILNLGGPSPKDVLALLKSAESVHVKRGHAAPKLEWTVWN